MRGNFRFWVMASKTATPATTHGALLLFSTDCEGGRLSIYSGGTCGGGVLIVGGIVGATSLGTVGFRTWVLVELCSRSAVDRSGSNGAESTEPSIKQNASVSSGYVRAQVGQRFIGLTPDG